MPDYLHGVTVTEINNGVRPIRTVSTAIIGLVATASDADADYFPEGQSVLLTDLAEAISKAGTKGTLAATLSAINAQTNAVVVAVRVKQDEDMADDDWNEQNGYTIGDTANGRRTGLQALLAAKNNHGVTPRIIGAPGLDTQEVTTELVTIAQKLGAFAYAACHGATVSEAQAYRQNFGARELMLIDNTFVGFNPITDKTEALNATAFALGLRAKIDNEIGWHKTLSNVPVNGVTGLVYDRSFELMSSATDVNLLNEKDITTLIRQEGFRFWGDRTTTADKLFAFENYTRTAQVLKDTIAQSFLWAMDKPLTVGLSQDIIDGIDIKLKELTSLGYLIGGRAWYDPKLNTPTTLKDGQLHISYDYTPVPPLEQLHLRQHITDTYLVDFAARVNAI